MKFELNYQQSGVIPYRWLDSKLEILLITSRKKQKWIIPKGYVEFNLTPFESAKKEAFEEAGVLGSNETIKLGEYEFDKSIGTLLMTIYSMEVTNILKDYPEKDERKRKWFDIEEAANKITIPELREMIFELEEQIKV